MKEPGEEKTTGSEAEKPKQRGGAKPQPPEGLGAESSRPQQKTVQTGEKLRSGETSDLSQGERPDADEELFRPTVLDDQELSARLVALDAALGKAQEPEGDAQVPQSDGSAQQLRHAEQRFTLLDDEEELSGGDEVLLRPDFPSLRPTLLDDEEVTSHVDDEVTSRVEKGLASELALHLAKRGPTLLDGALGDDEATSHVDDEVTSHVDDEATSRVEKGGLPSGRLDRQKWMPVLTMEGEPTSFEGAVGDLSSERRDAVMERYELEGTLGKGGMGLVLTCRDKRIGRRVAMKVIRRAYAHNPDVEERFVREARVQGQLEHPSVVPVYDLGVGENGTAYFTMKRVRGVTLKQVLQGLRDGAPGFAEKYSLHRLLTGFCSVCLAVDFSHKHGVLHRDLKPSNIMLGDYGEVYVLDWGIAKVSKEEELPRYRMQGGEGQTSTSTLLGTLGYMSPEQMRGGERMSLPTSDVYSLGAILYQILTLRKLHESSSREEVMRLTLEGPPKRPSVEAPERGIAMELDEICLRAVSRDTQTRYQSARALYEAVDLYLSGLRDERLRRDLALKHALSASQSLEAHRGEAGIEARRQAMGHIGRALALDPSNALALETMVRLFDELPEELPQEVHQQIHTSREQLRRWTGIFAGGAYLSLLLYLPLFFWLGIRSTLAINVFYVLAIGSSAFSFWTFLTRGPRVPLVWTVMVVSTLCFVASMTLFGPLILMPALIAVNTSAFSIIFEGWQRVICVLIGCLAVAVPVLLELFGALPPSYSFSAAGMLVMPNALELPRVGVLGLLGIASVATVITASVSVSYLRDSLSRAERRLYLHSWLIRQLVSTPTTEEARNKTKRQSES